MTAMPMSAALSASAGAALLLAAWLLASYFGLHAAVSGARVLGDPTRPSAAPCPDSIRTLRLAGCCRAIMSAGMGYMLLSML